MYARRANRITRAPGDRGRSAVSRALIIFGLALLANAVVVGFSSGGSAQDDPDQIPQASAEVCRAFDLWETSGFSPAFAGTVALALEDVDLPSAVAVAANGLANDSLDDTNQGLAAATLMAYLIEACDAVEREDSDSADDSDSNGDADSGDAGSADDSDSADEAAEEDDQEADASEIATDEPEATPVPRAIFEPSPASGGGQNPGTASGVNELPATGSNFTMMLTMVGLTFVATGAMLRAQHAPIATVGTAPPTRSVRNHRRPVDLTSPPVAWGVAGLIAMSIAVWSLLELLF